MIDIAESELASIIMGELKGRIQTLIEKHQYGPGLLHEINTLFVDTRQRCKNQDIDFPEMAVLILPSVKAFVIVRADLDRPAIEIVIVNTATQYPDVDMVEMAEAIHAAYPDFKPTMRLKA